MIKTFDEYLAISSSDSTIKTYKKLINTLRRSPDPEAHISSLSPSTQRPYRTAWNHWSKWQEYSKSVEQEVIADEVSEAIRNWGGDKNLLKSTNKTRNTSNQYADIEGFAFYGEGENVISLPLELAELLERHATGDTLL
tara:strand:- start:241 stop:657 length:417 start_codon:yes stop_codon:yes gene_type:complete